MKKQTSSREQPPYNRDQLHLPFSFTPGFAKRLGRAAETMCFADAVTSTLEDSGIKVEIEGDLPSTNGGLLLAGDHSQRIEPLLVQALASKAGRDSMRVIAQPDSFAGRLMQDSGPAGVDSIIPVMHTGLSDQYQPTLAENPHAYYYKHKFPGAFNLPVDTLRQINSDALNNAANTVADGGAVAIFPTGGAITEDWRGGFGKIASLLDTTARANTEISLLQPDPFSMKKVVGALALRELGIRPRSKTLVLQNYNAGKVADILGVSDDYAADFTKLVRELYSQQYGK